ncbi:MAG: hypothetical protein KGH61_00485 [Candidatus Micrarchaeota archaeon]|nr:hypothetical protein [Candidatus Micrarchaeota archaeon]MDE1847413.1 hypothetical protein [Candidatus Micrarchaeota archaeon]MDE1864092.1 hypothetical protein [Candidatus Micrarchaeota archaeon]
MALEFLNPILNAIPAIKKPVNPLTIREKLKWTALVMVVYFMLFSIPAIGSNIAALSQPTYQLANIIFAARVGSLITVGITPIILSSIVLQLLQGSGVIKIDMQDPEQKAKMQGIQKISAIIIALIEAYILVATRYVPLANGALAGIVMVQLALGAIFIIFLDEIMSKYGITSGINMFIAGGVAYSIVAGTINIILVDAINAITAGGASAIPNAILAFGPLFFAIMVFLISIYVYDIKVEIPIAFSQFRGVGGRFPIPLLYTSVLPVVLATSFILSMTVWFRFLAGATGTLGNIAKFLAFYQLQNGQLTLVGGLVYLISPLFPAPYAAPYGIGGYGAYFGYLATHTTSLYLPWGAVALVPEWIHIVVYTLVLIAACVVFGKFWIEMTGQSPKNVANQLQDVGMQIPGFRRDPRIIEGVLNKYIPTIAVLGSAFVGLLAALATLTGAVGTGVGILLTVGIMYMVYQQLERENALSAIPGMEKIISS